MAMERPENILCERVEALLRDDSLSSQKRIIIAMAGAPGSGKSVISAALVKLFNERNVEQMKVVPMVSYMEVLISVIKFLSHQKMVITQPAQD